MLDFSSISNYIVTMKTQQIISLISKIRYRANTLIMKELENYGVTGIAPSHGDILAVLFNRDAVPMSELAQAINRKKNTITTLVDKLIGLGYVEKINDIDDARFSLIQLTEKGKKLKPCFDEVSDKLISTAYSGMSESETEKLLRLLIKMNDNFNKYI